MQQKRNDFYSLLLYYLFNKMKKLAFIDLEGTLIHGSEWENLRDKFGAAELSKTYSKLYDRGKIGFEEWRQELAKIWNLNKTTKQQFISELKKYKVLTGARELIQGLKKKGFKTIIITGAIDILAELVKNDLGIDEVYSAHNFLFDKNSFFQDIKTVDDYGEGKGKVNIIRSIIEKEKANPDDCIAIGGDDINDYWMLKELKSFSVKPHIKQIKEVVDYEVESLVEILDYV
jgi:phosphoserine phosphatase